WGDDLAGLHLDLLPGPRTLHAADDHAVLGLDPAADHPQLADQRAELDHPGDHRAFAVDRIDQPARGVGDDREIGHQQRLVGLRAGKLQPADPARPQEAVGVPDQRATLGGARAGIDDRVDEIDLAGVAVGVLVLQPYTDLGAGTGEPLALVLEQQRLRAFE